MLTCPVHVVGEFFRRVVYVIVGAGASHLCAWRSLPERSQPFKLITPPLALASLRSILLALKVPNGIRYRTHDLRRGHAQDLLESGASLVEILRAGEWRSAAFAEYLDEDKVEASAVLDAHYCASDDEDA